jgi:hypothetical protein
VFIRWQKRVATHWSNQGVVHFNCVLVENVRIDGKHRSRHVANLGGIRSDALEDPAALAHFWSNVDDALKPLKLSREDRDMIHASLAQRVGKRPDREKVAIAKRKAEKAAAKIASQFIESEE